MASEFQEALAQEAEQSKELEALVSQYSTAEKLDGAVFATTAKGAKVIGELNWSRKTSRFGAGKGPEITSEKLEGIDKVVAGILSHNGKNLSLITVGGKIFDLPFDQLKIEPYSHGLLVTAEGQTYLIGAFGQVNSQLSPAQKMKYNFGSEAIIWMRELGSIGIVDIQAYEKTRNRAKLWTVGFFLLVAILSLAMLYAS